jgi:hypothetical protein
MTDRPPHPPKKTEMIEVRVSAETKHDFLDACRRARRTASEGDDFVVRSKSIPRETIPEAPAVIRMNRRLPGKRWLAAGGALATVALFAAMPSTAQPDLAAAFRALDANGDSSLTPEEFSLRGRDGVARHELIKVRQVEPRVAAAADEPPVLFLLPPDAEAMARMKDVRYIRMDGAEPAPVTSTFGDADANSDGRVDLAEFVARQTALLANGFRRLDADISGSLDKTEYQALTRPLLVRPGSAGLLDQNAMYGGLRSHQGLEGEFSTLDANGNGTLSLEEYLPR